MYEKILIIQEILRYYIYLELEWNTGQINSNIY